jgi:hypothetical protein
LKYFICALDKINVGIPAGQTERIIQVTRVQCAVRETENQEVFISLPVLFQQKDNAAPHGLVLKSDNTEQSGFKTVLMTPPIDAELEIPEDDIYNLPKALSGVFKFFRGAYCTDQNVILILDPEKLKRGCCD